MVRALHPLRLSLSLSLSLDDRTFLEPDLSITKQTIDILILPLLYSPPNICRMRSKDEALNSQRNTDGGYRVDNIHDRSAGELDRLVSRCCFL